MLSETFVPTKLLYFWTRIVLHSFLIFLLHSKREASLTLLVSINFFTLHLSWGLFLTALISSNWYCCCNSSTRNKTSTRSSVLVDIATSHASSFKCLNSTRCNSSSDLTYPVHMKNSLPPKPLLRADLPISSAKSWASLPMQLIASETHLSFDPYKSQILILPPILILKIPMSVHFFHGSLHWLIYRCYHRRASTLSKTTTGRAELPEDIIRFNTI